MTNYRYHRRPRRMFTARPFVAFLLIASFGIMFAGCGGSTEENTEEQYEEFTFTEDDVERFRELVGKADEEFDSVVPGSPYIKDPEAGEQEVPVLDLSKAKEFSALRQSSESEENGMFKVTNPFLNVRSAPNVTSSSLSRLEQGDTLTLIGFENAAWAKVRIPDETEGFVSTRYIAKVVTEQQLAEERAKYEGTYFVDFGFLNVRAEPDTASAKLGELPGQELIVPLSMDEVWARVLFDGKEGYVAREYLSPFIPNFLVRQNSYTLPIVHYRLSMDGITDDMVKHLGVLQERGYKFITLSEFYDLLLQQEERDVRLNPKTIIVAVSDVLPELVDELNGVLLASGVDATVFLTTKHVGPNGIDGGTLSTMVANGYDLQSAGHTGDDLRSLTNEQMRLELVQSQKIIEDSTGTDVIAIAYPIGGVNERVVELAEQNGYLFGVGTAKEIRFSRDGFLKMPSIVVSPGMTVESLVALLDQE